MILYGDDRSSFEIESVGSQLTVQQKGIQLIFVHGD